MPVLPTERLPVAANLAHARLKERDLNDHAMRTLEDRTFLVILVAVSLAFVLIVWQFYGAVLWGFVAAVVFAPLNRRLLKALNQRRSLAAFLTIALIVLIVILPLATVTAALVNEAAKLYESIQSEELHIVRYIQQVFDALPSWVVNILDRLGLTNFVAIEQRLSATLVSGARFFATQVLNIGQNTVEFVVNLFVMLYLLFFLLRDGNQIAGRIRDSIPLRAPQQRALLDKFTVVIRATIKGDIVVALVQGIFAGTIFWLLGLHAALLLAVLTAIVSLLPAIGSALVWFPVAIYLFAMGAVWKGIALLAYGALVISLIDNFLRPILVGKDTRMPDYVVLISTLGGIVVFGINGFVIGPLIAALFITVWDIFSQSRLLEQK
jgi:predicted PurR-regulated permease PerM